MRKFYHFLEKPTYIPTRQERIRNMQSKDGVFMKLYFIAFILFFLTILVFGEKKAEVNDLDVLRSEICTRVKNSPLCVDPTLLTTIDSIAGAKGVPTRLVVGVMNAESSIMTRFNKPACSEYHNYWGLKGKKHDDGRIEMYAINRKRPDKNGCYLYRFKDFEDGVKSFVNTISIGYKACENNVTCISYDFVGDPNKSEISWVNNVEIFFKKV